MTECLACGRVDQLWLCARCTQDLAATLRKLPGLLVHLAESATGQTRLGGDGGRHTRSGPRMLHGDDSALAKCTCGHKWHEAECVECGCQAYDGVPNPAALQRSLLAIGGVNAQASQLQTVIRNSLSTIVRDLCETRGLTVLWDQGVTAPTQLVIKGIADGWLDAYPPLNGPTSADFARWLARHVDAIAADESAGVWFREIDGHTKAIEKILDRPEPLRFAGPCQAMIVDEKTHRERECGTRLLAKREATRVTCPQCKAEHDIERIVNRLLANVEHWRFTREELIGDRGGAWTGIMGLLEEPVSKTAFHRWIKGDKKRKPVLAASGYRRPNGQMGISRRSTEDEPVYRLSAVRKLRVQLGERQASAMGWKAAR